MSYLKLPDGIADFRKAVVSLWFRVPQSTIDAVVAIGDELPPAYFFILPYTIPLVTLGRPQTRQRRVGIREDVSNWTYTPAFPAEVVPIYDTPVFAVEANDPVDPCYIGLRCYPRDGANVMSLTVNIQREDMAALSQIAPYRSRVDVYPTDPGIADLDELLTTPGTGWTAGSNGAVVSGVYFTVMTDVAAIQGPLQAEQFLIEAPQVLAADHWHHLLLSFDLSDPCSSHGPPPPADISGSAFHDTAAEGTDSYCRLWYALDDVNYDGATNLAPYGVDGSIDQNAILTANAYDVATSGTNWPENCTFGPATCLGVAASVPADGVELGIPAGALYVDYVQPVEMAELQLFSGVSLDTSLTANRRAFVAADGKPVDPADAEALLGRKPDLLLHGSSNWIHGTNTGSPATALTPTGKIVSYTPGPSLGGDQGAPSEMACQ